MPRPLPLCTLLLLTGAAASAAAQPTATTETQAPRPLAQVLADAGVADAAPSDWASVELDIDADALAVTWGGMTPDDREDLLDHLLDCRAFIASDPSAAGVFNVTVLRFDNARAAANAVERLEQMSRDNFAAGVLPELNPDDVVYGTMPIPDATATSTIAFAVDLSDDEAGVQTLRVARAARGHAVVELTRVNLDPAPDATTALVAATLDASDAPAAPLDPADDRDTATDESP